MNKMVSFWTTDFGLRNTNENHDFMDFQNIEYGDERFVVGVGKSYRAAYRDALKKIRERGVIIRPELRRKINYVDSTVSDRVDHKYMILIHYTI